MQDDMASALRRPMQYVLLKGNCFISYTIRGSGVTYYRSSNPVTIKGLADACLRQPEAKMLHPTSFVYFIPVGVSDAQWREEGLAATYEVDSEYPETRGPLFLKALDAM